MKTKKTEIEVKRESTIDGLLAEFGHDKDALFGPGGLLTQLTKAVVERALKAELAEHLENGHFGGLAAVANSDQSSGPEMPPNCRNGSSPKTIRGDTGSLQIGVPRDRNGTFEPQLVPKWQKNLPGFSEKITALYARGMSVRDIQGLLEEQYHVEVSPDLISRVTAAVQEEVTEWQKRPLDPLYALVFFDAIRVRIREEGTVCNKAVYLAIGVTPAGQREVLGLWIEQQEGAKFWLQVMNELHLRGMKDILIAVVDGLKGFPAAINAVFPKTEVQTCIVHLIRTGLSYCGWQDRSQVAAALKPVYHAANAAEAEERLIEFEAGPWGKKYPIIAASWRRVWEHVIPFFDYPEEVRKIIYTTNAIESLNSQLRRRLKTKGHFPSDAAASKLMYLALREITKSWTAPPHGWKAAMNQFAIKYEARFSAISAS
jgi:putative transposase